MLVRRGPLAPFKPWTHLQTGHVSRHRPGASDARLERTILINLSSSLILDRIQAQNPLFFGHFFIKRYKLLKLPYLPTNFPTCSVAPCKLQMLAIDPAAKTGNDQLQLGIPARLLSKMLFKFEVGSEENQKKSTVCFRKKVLIFRDRFSILSKSAGSRQNSEQKAHDFQISSKKSTKSFGFWK